MWIPEPLYTCLPAIYAASGVCSVAVLGINSLAAFSAALFIGAAGVVTTRRIRYRSAKRASANERARRRRAEARSLKLD